MNQRTLLLLALVALVVIYIFSCNSEESFFIPQNIVGGGDFHIQPPGAIADQGSFTNDMEDYFQGQGPI